MKFATTLLALLLSVSATLPAVAAIPSQGVRVARAPVQRGPVQRGPVQAGPLQAAPGKQALAAEIIVAHATNTGGGIDAKLKDLPQLRQPPFSAYDTYRLIDRGTVALAQGSPGQMPIVDDRLLSLALEEVVTKGREPSRYRVKATLSKKDGADATNVVALLKTGERFFVAGQKYKGGILVIVIKLR